MIPILFNATETAFTSQGLGALADAVSVSVSRVINGKDELVMVYPSTGIRYADLANDRIIFAAPEYKKTAQPYQIYKITKPMNGLVTVYARHVGSVRPGYLPVRPFTAGSLTEVLNVLPNYIVENNPFTFWTNKTVTADFELAHPASLGKVLGGMAGSILDVYGGEYEFDGYTIKLWNRRGQDSGVELRYGKNITDIEQSEDFEDIVTGVVPYWQGMDGTTVTLPEVVVQGQYADTYSFRRTIVMDFTQNFSEQPSQADLRAAATSYVSQAKLGVPNINLKVSFEHLAEYSGYENLQLLEKLNLGDTVSIFYEPLDVSATARIAKTTFDCLNEKYTSVEIGSVKSDLAQVMRQVNSTAEKLKETVEQNLPSAIEEAISNATDLITGADGGYVVIDRDANGKPYQILIMDTDSKATATNVIRINQNGIGFSTTGYSGPFSTAWTIDSNFVADFITVGTLNAALAKIGVLSDAAGKNSWNMATGEISINDGKIIVTVTKTFHYEDYDQSDITYISDLVSSGIWSDADIEKYDINLDGQITLADLIKVRNMILNSEDAVVSIKTVIDPSDTSKPICIYNNFGDAGSYMNLSFVGAPNAKFTRLFVGDNLSVLPSGYVEWSGYGNLCIADPHIGFNFYDNTDPNNPVSIGTYPPDASQFCQANNIGVNKLDGCAYWQYSEQGQNVYSLESDHTYLVTYVRRNSTDASSNAVWIVSTHSNNSNIVTLKSGTGTTASVSGLTLSVTRGNTYGRVTLTRLA